MRRDDRSRGRRIEPRKASAAVLAERRADEELARTMINQILGLQAQGVLLPQGWGDKRPMTLRYLNTMLSLAIAMSAARG